MVRLTEIIGRTLGTLILKTGHTGQLWNNEENQCIVLNDSLQKLIEHLGSTYIFSAATR
jgi:hypothetical protein